MSDLTAADRSTAARLADLIPDGPTRRFLADMAAGNHTHGDYKEHRP